MNKMGIFRFGEPFYYYTNVIKTTGDARKSANKVNDDPLLLALETANH